MAELVVRFFRPPETRETGDWSAEPGTGLLGQVRLAERVSMSQEIAGCLVTWDGETLSLKPPRAGTLIRIGEGIA